MKNYDSYKDSGIDWIGQIPKHWHLTKLKFENDIVMGQSPDSSDVNSEGEGIPFIQGNAEFGKLHPKPNKWCNNPNKTSNTNDVLLSVRAPVGAINITEQQIGIGRGLCAIRQKETNYKYIFYFIHVAKLELQSLATGSTFTAISVEDVKNLLYLKVPLFEQNAIADFLDKKTSKIDSLIEKKKQLIELLKEEQAVLINNAVTKGINPNVKMKDSGIEWIGEIPEHWHIKRLKYLAKICNGKDQKEVLDENGKYPVYGSGGVFGMANTYLYGKPSVLLGRKGTIDKPQLVEHPFWTVDTSYYTIVSKDVDINYFYFLCTTINFDLYKYGSAIPSMTQGHLNEIRFAIPNSLKEQQKVVNYIKQKTLEIDVIISKTKKEIELLQEYRTALISEVVTGKIDVRDEVLM